MNEVGYGGIPPEACVSGNDVDGRRLAGDLVLSAIGLRPRTALAAGAGLPCDHGILTDAEFAEISQWVRRNHSG